MELGVLEGEEVEVVAYAPLGDPIEIRLGDSRLSLRRREAAGIEIHTLEDRQGNP
jgi:Fe2+ transport system protein FeoA